MSSTYTTQHQNIEDDGNTMVPDALAACFGGVVPPICTPLTPTGEVDVESLRSLRERFVSVGVSGVFALGSAGEAAYLHDRARATVVEVLGKEKAGEAFLVGLVEPTTNRVLDALDRLVGPEVDAIVVTAPFYARPSETEIRRHFETVAAHSPVPVLAYDIPVNVGHSLPTAVIRDLICEGTLAGIKDSSTDLSRLRALVDGTPAGAHIFTGSDSLLDCALQIGANGVVAGLANVAPEVFVAAMRAHTAGDTAALAQAQCVITTLTRLYEPTDPAQGPNATVVGAIKTALQLLGVIEHDTLAAPMTPSSPERVAYVRSVLEAAGL